MLEDRQRTVNVDSQSLHHHVRNQIPQLHAVSYSLRRSRLTRSPLYVLDAS